MFRPESLLVWLISLAILMICFAVFMQTYWIWWINQARRRGLYPDKGKATMFDVRRLLIEGEKPLAIRLYAQIFKTNYRQAKKAVDELERSIQKKYFELE